jgi:hypothetical protein
MIRENVLVVDCCKDETLPSQALDSTPHERQHVDLRCIPRKINVFSVSLNLWIVYCMSDCKWRDKVDFQSCVEFCQWNHEWAGIHEN